MPVQDEVYLGNPLLKKANVQQELNEKTKFHGASPYSISNISFAYAPGATVQAVLNAVNDPSCYSWLGLYFD